MFQEKITSAFGFIEKLNHLRKQLQKCFGNFSNFTSMTKALRKCETEENITEVLQSMLMLKDGLYNQE